MVFPIWNITKTSNLNFPWKVPWKSPFLCLLTTVVRRTTIDNAGHLHHLRVQSPQKTLLLKKGMLKVWNTTFGASCTLMGECRMVRQDKNPTFLQKYVRDGSSYDPKNTSSENSTCSKTTTTANGYAAVWITHTHYLAGYRFLVGSIVWCMFWGHWKE